LQPKNYLAKRGYPVLPTTARNNGLGKTAEAICSYLKTPDIIGVVEVENIGVLTQLADTINNGQVPTGNAVPACNTAPGYVPYLVEGNDVGGIDVGFLVSSKIVGQGTTPRYAIGSVNLAEFFVTVTIWPTFFLPVGLSLWPIIAGLIIGGVIAAPFAAIATKHIPDKVLMLLVGCVVVLLSLRTILMALT